MRSTKLISHGLLFRRAFLDSRHAQAKSTQFLNTQPVRTSTTTVAILRNPGHASPRSRFGFLALPFFAVGAGSLAVWAKSSSADSSGIFSGRELAPWVQDLAERPGTKEVGSPGGMLAKNPVRQMFLEEDHLFEAMMRVEMVKGIQCFYDNKEKQFHAVVKLGREVCGYPSTVHGGLTAAIIDETLGGLMVSLWKSGALGFSMPAVTARLEVDYCKKVPQNALVLCSTEIESVEGRKLWMKASLTDGPGGGTYATARALFVVPKLKSVVGDFVGNLFKREQ